MSIANLKLHIWHPHCVHQHLHRYPHLHCWNEVSLFFIWQHMSSTHLAISFLLSLTDVLFSSPQFKTHSNIPLNNRLELPSALPSPSSRTTYLPLPPVSVHYIHLVFDTTCSQLPPSLYQDFSLLIKLFGGSFSSHLRLVSFPESRISFVSRAEAFVTSRGSTHYHLLLQLPCLSWNIYYLVT